MHLLVFVYKGISVPGHLSLGKLNVAKIPDDLDLFMYVCLGDKLFVFCFYHVIRSSDVCSLNCTNSLHYYYCVATTV